MIGDTRISDVTNADQERAWDGTEGAYWAAHHELFEAALAHYQPAFLEAAAIQPGDRALDVGCGTGVSTRAVGAAATAGHALGIDLSAEMIDVARRLAGQAGLANVTFEQGDAQIHPFAAEAFDVVVSRTGAMFFGRPEAAFANLAGSLKPGGRLVLLVWQPADRQEWIGEFTRALLGRTPPAPPADAPGPFSLGDPARVRSVLGTAGFTDVRLTPVTEPMAYGRTVDEAHDFVLGLLGWMLQGQDESRRVEAADALRRTLTDHLTADGVHFGSAAWLVTARRSAAAR
jgi:SAM-dependent methyltransferase